MHRLIAQHEPRDSPAVDATTIENAPEADRWSLIATPQSLYQALIPMTWLDVLQCYKVPERQYEGFDVIDLRRTLHSCVRALEPL